jgi:TRAP-type C4-dicarboxylate transport system permease small subunit
MKKKRDFVTVLFNVSTASGATFASIFAFAAGHSGLGWLSASVAALNFGGAFYGAAVVWRANHHAGSQLRVELSHASD